MHYNVGDKVITGYVNNLEQQKYSGKICTVKDVALYPNGDLKFYTLEETENCIWHNEDILGYAKAGEKYRLFIDSDGDLYVRAVKDFGSVRAGDLGGEVENENTLSQSGDCWVDNDSSALGNAVVRGNAQVKNCSHIRGNATVEGNAVVEFFSFVEGDAVIDGDAAVHREARIGGTAHVGGTARIFGEFDISSGEILSGTYDYENLSDRDRLFASLS